MMEVSFTFITGLAFGVEYVAADEQAGIEFPAIILDFACLRWVIEFTDEQ